MKFWNESSTGVKVAIVAAAVVALCAVLAICAFLFNIVSGSPEPATPTPVVTVIVPTAEPGTPTVTANTDVNVRSGPGLEYPVIGTMLKGQTAEAIGVSPGGDWWVIKFPAADNGQGWVKGEFVNPANTDNLPVIQPPPPPPPEATATPVIITDWKGEYFDNPDVAGDPVLVRNDRDINFNFGSDPPAPGLPADNYAIRWSRQSDFDKGVYTFQVQVEGGVRLWVDGVLLIDQWASQGFRPISVDSQELSRGAHDLRVDYFKQTGNGQISVNWSKRQEAGPPTAVINGTTQAQVSEEAAFNARSSSAAEGSHLQTFDWDFGDGSAATGVDVTHIYNSPGSYSVQLTVTDDKDLSDTAVHQIQISEAPAPDEPPVAVISGPNQIEAGQTVTFDGSASYGTNAIVNYTWEFGDGTTGNGATVDKIYTDGGSYNVILTVVDDKGLSSQATHQIAITEAEATPEATATPDPVEALENQEWALINNAQNILDFDGGVFAGFAGCNTINGEYKAEGNNISLVVQTQTNELCDDTIMARQTAYLSALQTTNSFQVTGKQLTLSGFETLTYNGTPK